MLGNTLSMISDCTETDAFAAVYYLYKLINGLNILERHGACQNLFLLLLEKLKLEKRADFVCKGMIQMHLKNKLLHVKIPKNKTSTALPPKTKNRENSFEEDEEIFDACGDWSYGKSLEKNIVRLVFAESDGKRADVFLKLIELIFFTTEEKFVDENGKYINPEVPDHIKNASKDFSQIQFLLDTFKLNDEEAAFLLCVYRFHVISEMTRAVSDFFRYGIYTPLKLFALCLDTKAKNLSLLLKSDRNLVLYDLLDSQGSIDNDAIDAIRDKDLSNYFYDVVKNENNNDSYTLESFSVSKEKTDLAVKILQSTQPCNLLLYGASGAGKTEFAKALIKAAGLKMTSYRNNLEIIDDIEIFSYRALNRLKCYLSLKREDSVLMVDEAENLLRTVENTSYGKRTLPQKEIINKMLDNSESKTIWILNQTDDLDESTLSRFTYSICFYAMSEATLKTITKNKLKTVNNLSDNLKADIVDMCGHYQISGSSVDNIVNTVNNLSYADNDKNLVLSDVKKILEANSVLLAEKKQGTSFLKKGYNLDVLNTSIPASEIVEMVENALSNRENYICDDEGIKMYFYGLSGTGKSALARYIADRTGKKLLTKRVSDIMDKYVGESEKNLSRAFEEAEENDAILLFDEADSFFSDRTNSFFSWERTLVNEFLTQVEAFSGILICTSNLRKVMDPAMQRRFHLLVEFKPLQAQGIKGLLNSYFHFLSFTDEQIASLIKCDSVTPGDFASLNSRLRFLSKAKINSDYIISELNKMQNEKLNGNAAKIGFAS